MTDRDVTRRTSLKTMGAIGAAGVLGTGRPSPVRAAGPATYADALAIVGDRYHNPDYIRTGLDKTLVTDAGLSIDYLWEDRYLTPELLANYKMLIVFRDGIVWPGGYGGWYPGIKPGEIEIASDPPIPELRSDPKAWMTAEQGRAIKAFVENGGALLAYHNNSQVSLTNQDYRDVEGAVYNGHPAIRAFWVRITDHNHPVTQGVDDFLVVDEQHYVLYDKDPKYVLARSENAEGISYGARGPSCEAAWAYDYGKGRVCFLAPGHMISVMWNPAYERMQQNAARWLLKQT